MPVFNEGERTIAQLRGIPENLPDCELFIIDDGSNDGSIVSIEHTLPTLPIKGTLVHNDRNRGVGYSLKRGIRHALENKFDIIMNCAGNGKDDLRQIPIVLGPILNGTHEYVTGSRFLTGGSFANLPLARKLMIKGYTFVWNVLTGKKLSDVTNGFRAYSTRLFDDVGINIEQDWLDRYELEYYLYYKVLTRNHRWCEVPVSKTYPQQTAGTRVRYSKIRPIVDWWKMIRPVIYLWLGIKK